MGFLAFNYYFLKCEREHKLTWNIAEIKLTVGMLASRPFRGLALFKRISHYLGSWVREGTGTGTLSSIN
jgi:hypothetical protein